MRRGQSRTRQRVLQCLAATALLSLGAQPALAASADAATTSAGVALAVEGAEGEVAPERLADMRITSLTPAITRPGTELRATVAITNTTTAVINAPALELWVGWRPLNERDLLEEWASSAIGEIGSPHSRTTIEPLAPGQTRTASVAISVDSLYMGNLPAGAFRLALTLRDGQRNDGTLLTQVRTFMLWDPAAEPQPNEDPMRLTLLAPLTGPAIRLNQNGPDPLIAAIAPGQPLAQVIAAATAIGQIPRGQEALALAIDPALISAAMASDDEAVVAWAHDVLAIEQHSDKFTLPAYDPDLGTLARAGLTEYSLADILHTPLAHEWQPPDTWREPLAWPADALPPDIATLEAARSAGLTAAVVENGLAPTGSAPSSVATPSSVANIPLASGDMTALVADAQLSQLFYDGTHLYGDDAAVLGPVEMRQRALAEAAVIAGTAPGPEPHILVVLPRGWNPDVDALVETVSALNDSGWVHLSPLRELWHADPPIDPRTQLPLLAQQSGELTADRVRQLESARTAVDMVSTVSEDPSLLRNLASPWLTAPLAVAWRDRPAERDSAVTEALENAEKLATGLTAVVTAEVTMISASGSLPITVRNALPVPARVVVRLETSDTRLLVEQTPTIDVAAESEASLMVPVSAVASGNVQVDVQLTSEHGDLVAAAVPLHLRIRAGWETLGTALIAALIAVFLVGGIVRAVRRGRSDSRTSDEHLPLPMIVSDHQRDTSV